MIHKLVGRRLRPPLIQCLRSYRSITFAKSSLLSGKRLTSVNMMSKRSLMNLFDRIQQKVKDVWEEPLRLVYQKDTVSRARYILVYKSGRHLVIPALGITTIFVLLFACNMAYEAFYVGLENIDPDYDEDANAEKEIILGLFIALHMVIMMGRFITRYVTRVYYNEPKQQFIITTYNLLMPWTTQTRVVKAGTGKILATHGTFKKIFGFDPKITSNCTVDGKPYMLHAECFKYPVYFNVLFGYDDPEAITKLRDSNVNADRIFRERAQDRIR